MQMLECRWEGGAGLGNMKHSGQIGWRKAYMDFTPETFEKVENSFYLKQMYKEILHSTSTLHLHPLAFCACYMFTNDENTHQMFRMARQWFVWVSKIWGLQTSWTSSPTLSLWTSPPAPCPSTSSGWSWEHWPGWRPVVWGNLTSSGTTFSSPPRRKSKSNGWLRQRMFGFWFVINLLLDDLHHYKWWTSSH